MNKKELIKKIVSEFTNDSWVDNMTDCEEMDNAILYLDEWLAKNLHKPPVSSCCQHIWDNIVILDRLHIEYYCSKCGKKRPVGNYC